MPRVNRVTIIGLGLIGGSLGLALKRHRIAWRVTGYSRKTATLRRAVARRAIDFGTTDLGRAVRDAEIVVLATPVETVVPLARRAASAMAQGSVLTDVGSTKALIVRALERGLPRGVTFVGAHPLAGSERQGIEAADWQLFDGSICVVTPTVRTNHQALKRVTQLWKPLVQRVVTMSPQRHDQLLASTSHLPHLLAFCLMQTAQSKSLLSAPRSLLEMTRIAKSSPELWDGIFLTNRTALLAEMACFDRQWRALRTQLIKKDRGGLRRLLSQAKAKRDALKDL